MPDIPKCAYTDEEIAAAIDVVRARRRTRAIAMGGRAGVAASQTSLRVALSIPRLGVQVRRCHERHPFGLSRTRESRIEPTAE